jgi:hypothetical protein
MFATPVLFIITVFPPILLLFLHQKLPFFLPGFSCLVLYKWCRLLLGEDGHRNQAVEASAVLTIEVAAVLAVEASAVLTIEVAAVLTAELFAVLTTEVAAVLTAELFAVLTTEVAAVLTAQLFASLITEVAAVLNV